MRASLILLAVVLFRPVFGAEKRIVSGRVIDEAGQPIAKAAIRVAKIVETITDSEGRFSFDNGSRMSVSIYVHHNDYVGERNSSPAPAAGIEIVLRRGLSIRGRVVFPDGTPMADAPVCSWWLPPFPQRIRSDVLTKKDGSFHFGGLRS